MLFVGVRVEEEGVLFLLVDFPSMKNYSTGNNLMFCLKHLLRSRNCCCYIFCKEKINRTRAVVGIISAIFWRIDAVKDSKL